jgi:hypothetical protein
MKSALKKMICPTYTIAKLMGLAQLKLHYVACHCYNPIVVYTMGKVGTTTLVQSFERNLTRTPIYHVHTLDHERIRKMEQLYRRLFPSLHTIHSHLLSSLFLQKTMLKQPQHSVRWKIITLVRDPMARNVSAFFQMLDKEYADQGFRQRIEAGGDPSLLSDMITFFLEHWVHSNALLWFDRELKRNLDVDVLSGNFPHEQGYRVVNGKHCDVLVMRIEDLSRCVDQAINEYLGVRLGELARGQSATKKYYSKTYRQFCNELVIPGETLDEIYQSRMVRHFYRDDEVEGFRSRWERSSRL